MTRLDPADLRAFVARDYARLELLFMSERVDRPHVQKSRLASMLYEAARETCPGWPTDADRLDDLAHHQRMCLLLARAAHVGTR